MHQTLQKLESKRIMKWELKLIYKEWIIEFLWEINIKVNSITWIKINIQIWEIWVKLTNYKNRTLLILEIIKVSLKYRLMIYFLIPLTKILRIKRANSKNKILKIMKIVKQIYLIIRMKSKLYWNWLKIIIKILKELKLWNHFIIKHSLHLKNYF